MIRSLSIRLAAALPLSLFAPGCGDQPAENAAEETQEAAEEAAEATKNAVEQAGDQVENVTEN